MHWHMYNTNSLPRSYIIDSDDRNIQGIFRKYWDQMQQAAYSIPEDFISSDERKNIEQLKELNSIPSLEKYLRENPLDPCDTETLKPYLFQIVLRLYVDSHAPQCFAMC